MKTPADSIVITGAALATSLGLTRDETWRAVRASQCGMGPLTALESPLAPDKLGGQALDLPADYRPDEPREVRYLTWTIAAALRDAGLAETPVYPSHRCGVMLGTTLHGMRAGGRFFRDDNYEPLKTFLASHTLARACAGFDVDGFAATTCSACSSSLGAIALAMTMLRAGELDLVIAGGYDTISEYVYGGFNSLKLVADGPLRPFAKDRQGMKLAEGYGIVILGTTLHGMRAGGEYFRSHSCEPLKNFLAGSTLQQSLTGFDLHGFAATTCSACSSSLSAIALAVTLLRQGELDLVVAGGYDTISEYVYGGFNALRLVAEGNLTPFAKDRAGMKLAEGYGIVVLERLQDATRRAAKPQAEILGYGESADAHHLTQPHPTGDGAARAIAEALADANLSPRDIHLIAAHATGTPDNDAGDYAAFSQIFGDQLANIPVTAFKSHLGHTLGGAGAVELILSAMALRDQVVPPCANSRGEDIEFPGLNLSTGTEKPARIRATLNTSLGFGGANTAA
ncbi:MAG: beta-ketoacyl synthase N-terminal-like domain-containing protein, partial [Tepidisphaeraceae bacterium]